jgi:signal peptidase
MSRRFRRGARRVLSVGLSLLLSATAIVLIGTFLLSVFGVARFVPILSNSMAPDMPVGSLAISVPVDRGSIVAGDVVIFTAPVGPDRRVIHRVTHVYGADEADKIRDWTTGRIYLETKGDNNPAPDPWIVTIGDDTLWTAGWPAIWLADRLVRFAVFGVAGLAIVVWALVVVWRRPQESAREPAGAAG